MRKYQTRILIAIASSLFLLVISYVYSNNPYPLVDDINHYAWLEYTRQNIVGDSTQNDSAVYVNVGYDKEVIPFKDEYGMPLGHIDITNRRNLIRLLRMLNKEHGYKYIFLDVRFEKGYDNMAPYDEHDSLSKTVDEVLFSEIRKTPRLVIATHNDIELADTSIEGKAARSDYLSTIISTNFVRYQFMNDSTVSVPLRIYGDMTGHAIQRKGLLYFDNGRLCHNCPFLQIPHSFKTNDEEAAFMNMETDILSEEYGIGEDFVTLTKDKFVFIGDYLDDLHDTYIGMQPGTYITHVATDSLFRGKHLVNWWSVTIIGILYFFIALTMFAEIDISRRIPFIKKYNSRFIKLLVSFFSISFVIYCFTDINYLFTGETFCMWIPSLYFTIMKTIINNK